MKWNKTLILLVAILTTPFTRGHNVEKRALIFPPTSLYGTFVAIAVPLDIPDRNVFVSYNFESNYSVVTNITQIDEVIFPNLPVIAARHSRSITRELAYTTLETKFQEVCDSTIDSERHFCKKVDSIVTENDLVFSFGVPQHGMSGRECMLRNICEAAETPLHHNGLLGHIMHIVFTPSSSKEEGLDDEYYEAEAAGLRGDCDRYLDLCPFSLFDVITRLVEVQQKL